MKHQNWQEFFKFEAGQEYSKKIRSFLDQEYAVHTIYPPRHLIFNAFNLTPLSQIKVVIIGQDPYHEPGQAMGLSFSVPEGVLLPPSLQNIYKEIYNDLGQRMKPNGDLTFLAKQGVLLLNALLSVRKSSPLSHKDIGYDIFLAHVLEVIDQQEQPIVFLLWGAFAKSLKKHLHNPRHLILEAMHPSPLSANQGGFFNRHHFSLTNNYLIENGLEPINWQN